MSDSSPINYGHMSLIDNIINTIKVRHLSIKNRLHFDLPSEIQFFSGGFRPLVPFLQDLPKTGRINVYK